MNPRTPIFYAPSAKETHYFYKPGDSRVQSIHPTLKLFEGMYIPTTRFEPRKRKIEEVIKADQTNTLDAFFSHESPSSIVVGNPIRETLIVVPTFGLFPISYSPKYLIGLEITKENNMETSIKAVEEFATLIHQVYINQQSLTKLKTYTDFEKRYQEYNPIASWGFHY